MHRMRASLGHSCPANCHGPDYAVRIVPTTSALRRDSGTRKGFVLRTIAIGRLLVATNAVHAQVASLPVADEVSCRACQITMSAVVTLGETGGLGELRAVPVGVRVDGRGRYWIWGGDDAGGPSVFNNSGRFIRLMGRRGQGPGEFEMVTDVIALPGDSVLVIDSQRRATLFGPDLNLVRIIPLAVTLSRSVVVNWPHSLVGFDHYGAGGRGGPVIHSVAFDTKPARVMRSFGPEWKLTDFKTMTAARRILAGSTNGLWAASLQQFRLERWSPNGELTLLLERHPAWPAPTSGELGKPDQPPPNAIQAIAEDQTGRLWVFINTAAPTWREGWPKGAGEMRASAFEQQKMFRTVVEVLDPRTARVVTRRLLDEWIIAVLTNERAAIYTADADGVPRLRIVDLKLEGSR